MKKIILILTIFFCYSLIFSQEKKEKNKIIQLDNTWGKEIFPFPISFAKNIDYKGIAEVRFPPKGWIKPEHDFFWTYTYAWSINLSKKITEKELESNLKKYFNGLNSVKNDEGHKQTLAKIICIKKKKSVVFFEGKVNIFDRFATNKRIVLNTKIEYHYCKKTKNTILFFKFSPKDYTHIVWQTLNTIELEKGVCNN